MTLPSTPLFRIAGLLFLFALTTVVSVTALGMGSVSLPTGEIFGVLTGSGEDSPETLRLIVMDIRLPRIMVALTAGGVLAVAGAAFQSLLRNPLADPFLLGVSGGAALGGVLAILSGWAGGGHTVQLSAFAGALSTVLFVYFMSRVGGRIPKYRMLLTGVVINAFFSALIMMLLSLSESDALANAFFWLMGDLSGAGWEEIRVMAPYVMAGVIALYLLSKEMNLLLLGENEAAELGVNVERSKLLIFVFASLITAAVVSATGLIGFVGLVVPHAARLLFGADHRLLLPACLLMGGIFLVLADAIARTVIAPTELPVGVITALIGGPAFVYLLKWRLNE